MPLPHDEYLVDIFDDTGKVIGQKRRADLDKVHDIVHAVYIFVFTPARELWIATLSNTATMYGGKLGCTAAGITRKGESAEQAARRTLSYELGINTYLVNVLGTELATLSDGVTRLMSVVTLVNDQPVENRDGTVTEMKRASRADMQQLLNDRFLFAPTFLWAWEKYQSKFPF